MKTLEEKIKEITEKHNKEVQDLKDHETIFQLIPSLKNASYHGHELYGRKASITLDVENIDECLKLITELKNANVALIPMGIERDSCTSIKAMELCKLEKTTPIAPIVYKIDNFKSEIEIFCEINGSWYEITMRTKFGHDHVFRQLVWRSFRYSESRSENPIDCAFGYSSDFMDYYVKWWSSDIRHSSYSLFSRQTSIGLDELFDELKRVKS